MKTKILKVKGDWQEVIDDCRATVDKPTLGKEPSEAFKRAILVSEHSPIRDISIKWYWHKMKHWVTVHWVRHKWEKFVQTQREDRAALPCSRDELPQGELQSFTGEANIQHLIDTMRKRLCYQASKETREYAEDLKIAIAKEVDEHIGWVMVPNCIYRCGCPEKQMCEEQCFYKLMQEDPAVGSHDIKKRYDAYNKLFFTAREGGND